MNRRVLTIIVLLALSLPVVSVLGQERAPDRSGIGWGLATNVGAADPAGEEALEAWSPPVRNGPGATITVTTTDDELNADGDCSLREAIEAANTNGPVDACVPGSGDDSILVPAGIYTLVIAGAGEDYNQTGDLDILDNLVIAGESADTTIVDGGRLDRVVHIHPGRTVEINDVTVTHGYLEEDNGAGILNSSATLTLNGAILRQNEVVHISINVGGAGLFNSAYFMNATAALNGCLVAENTSYGGGGITNAAAAGLTALVTLSNTIVSGNTAEFGGGIWHTWYSGAGAASAMILNEAVVEGNAALSDRGGGIAAYQDVGNVMTLTLIDSVVSGNTAVVQGGGIAIHGWDTVPVLTVDHSTISVNVAQGVAPNNGRGGGLWVQHSRLEMAESTVSGNIADGSAFASGDGGGMFVLDSPAEIVNSTISGNQALGSDLVHASGLGGGIIVVGQIDPASLTLTNTTVADNSSNVGGGGIANTYFGADATTTFKNSLVGGNTAPADYGPSCYNTDEFGGQGTLLSLGHNLEDYDTCEFVEPTDWPNTDPLLGPLQGNGGPTWTHALLEGSLARDHGDDEACPPTDQRGVARPQGPHCDISAFEADENPPEVMAVLPPDGETEVPLDATVVITFSEPISVPTFVYGISPDPGGWLEDWGANDTVVSLTHDVFAKGTVYSPSVTAAEDLAGNPMALPFEWSFTTIMHRIYLPLVLQNSG